VRILDRRGSDDPARWVPVRGARHAFASVRDVVLESAAARVTYERLNLVEQAGSHSLYVRRGKEWVRLTSPEYGDYTYWVSTVVAPAVAAFVDPGPNLARARFIYRHAGAFLEKTIALDRCSPGMFVRLRSDPANPVGEREIGVGRPLPVAFSKAALAVHPAANQHVFMNLAATAPPYWAAAVWPEQRLLAMIVLARPLATYSYQFDPRQFGYLTVNQLTEHPEDAGFQAFLGAVPFDADVTVAVSAAKDGVASAAMVAPADGEYAVWLRGTGDAAAEDVVLAIDGVAHELTAPPVPADQQLVAPRVALRGGEHAVEITGPTEGLVLVPLDGDAAFPEAVAAAVQATLRGDHR
jgi:hypothetical protein